MIRIVGFLAAILFAQAPATAQDRPGDFDFFVLALSWSPTWCAREGRVSTPQCRDDAGFVVHGLWPQYEAGYPEFCAKGEPEWVAERVVRSMLDIMPDPRLVIAEWRKHGTCSGLAPEEFFAATRAAYESIAIPAALQGSESGRTMSTQAVEKAFVAVNPGLSAGGMAVSCDAGKLGDVRICLTRELAFRACAEVDERGCRQGRIGIPAAD